MAVALRHLIQKEVFSPSDERVLGIVSVTKQGRKKKPSFLVISVNQQEDPPSVEINRVKTSDRKDGAKETFKRVKSWSLSELKAVDGHNVDVEGPEFDLTFDRQNFKWIASNVSDKRAFITQLYKVVHDNQRGKKARFTNIDEGKLREVLSVRENKAGFSGAGPLEVVALPQDDYKELSAHEEEDIEKLLLRDNAIQDAASFMENLSEELSQLDQGNIHALMGSEEQIQELMERLELGIIEIEKMEMKMNVYDELLSTVRDAMQKLGSQYSRILLQNNNLRALFSEVDDLVSKLDLDYRVEQVLLHEPLTSPSDIRDCELAARTLQSALQGVEDLPRGVEVLQAVTDQTERFNDLSSSFGRRFHGHVSGLFTLNSTLMLDNAQVRHTSGPSITSHSQVHADLLAYSKLMSWLKDCEAVRFSEVMEAYVRSFRPVYEEEIKALFAESKLSLGRVSDMKKPGGFLGRAGSNADIMTSMRSSPMSGSVMVLSPTRDRGGGGVAQSFADFSTTPGLSPAHDHNKPRFDQVFSMVLEQLQPVCMSEQKFLTSFFHFAKRSHSPSEEDHLEDSLDDTTDRGIEPVLQDDSAMGVDGVQGVLGQMFGILLPEIEGFIAHGERLDSYNPLHLLVLVSQRLMFAMESGVSAMSYLDETLKKALLYIKRLFDKFIVTKRRQIEDMKVPRGSKCGVLPCVTWFREFADKAEAIVMGTDRRADLDKAYLTLIEAVFNTIERVAGEHPKTPPDVIKFENYHRIVDILSRLKIVCLESKKEIAKKKFRSHKKDYVKNCLGRPLDKLSAFFEGVESLRASGTKPEEVGYRLDYSRNELKKCIKEYPGKEVKRGLEKLYRRVEKDVSETNLQVVWGAMQEAFIEQAQRFESLIAECYPGSNISLEFTIDNLTEYFANISAQK